jgi:phospho-N-acetylmuramoyl-pentapeptide-transferase
MRSSPPAAAKRNAEIIYNFLYPLADLFTPFNLFRYLTFRSIAAFLTALVLSFLIGGRLIRWLRSKQKQGQPIRQDGPASHIMGKKGTPTMGGLLILISLSVATLLWADLTNRYVWIVLGITVAFGAVGLWDDYLKVTKKNPKGVPGKMKLGLSIAAAAVAAYFISQSSPPALRYTLALPFFKDVLVPLGLVGFLVFAVLVIVGTSNAVNLTDGLDGLAIGPVIMASIVFGLISYVVGNLVYTNYLYLNHIPRSGELSVLLSALVGAGLGFLWFNAPPAMVFMGDTGSLAIGGALGTVAVVTKHEIVLAIVGGLFVLETVSVIVQVLSYKWTGRRIFRMAPLHHHFEQKGWAEPTIVFRFWIIAAILSMVGLATLKLR